jgi:hypothetical protein
MPALLDRPSQNVWSLWSHGNGMVATTMDTSNDEAAITPQGREPYAGSSPIGGFAW